MKNKVLSIIVAIALTISVLAITTGSVSAASNIAKIHPDDVNKVNQVIAPPANTFRK